MDFTNYVVNSGLVDVAMGTLIGTSTTNTIRSIRDVLINGTRKASKEIPYILFEYLFTLFLVFIIFYTIVSPLLQDRFERMRRDDEHKRQTQNEVSKIRQSLQKIFFL